ncbi:MAG TPA: peptidoglycan recognition family protein [Planctomycetaceae bacterium]|nr:peptidoglycan recognition family protein [Planctomycetaceae bacterium]
MATALLGGLTNTACTPSPVLPPTASVPNPQFAPSLGNVGRRPQTPGMTASNPSLAGNSWKPTAPPRQWQYLVVHHTATDAGSVESIHEAHLKNKDKNGNPWLGIGYHFVIGNGRGMADGAIEPTFRWRTQIQGAHAGSSNKDYNERGVGICLVGNFEEAPPTAAQRRSVKLLVQTLKSEYHIPAANVVGHKDIRASATECPGKFFPMSEIAADDPSHLFGFSAEGFPTERVASTSGSSQR